MGDQARTVLEGAQEIAGKRLLERYGISDICTIEYLARILVRWRQIVLPLHNNCSSHNTGYESFIEVLLAAPKQRTCSSSCNSSALQL